MIVYSMKENKVGIGEVKVAQGEVLLSAYGVGSCVVIILYDTEKKIGALGHCLLPEGDGDSCKYPQGALQRILEKMLTMGTMREKLVAKIVGGATMFEGFARHEIGKRNVKQARAELEKLDIPVIAEDVFGNWGRTVLFRVDNGEVKVRSFRHGEKVL